LSMEATRVHRLLRTLSFMGLVRQMENRKYAPGPAIHVLAAQTLTATGLGAATFATLEALRRQTGYIVSLGVVWEKVVTYIYHSDPIATVWPASISGVGMILLANEEEETIRHKYAGRAIPGYNDSMESLIGQLKKIKKTGYAFVSTLSKRKHQTLSVTVPQNAHLGLGISGVIPESDIPILLAQLRLTAENLAENIRQGALLQNDASEHFFDLYERSPQAPRHTRQRSMLRARSKKSARA